MEKNKYIGSGKQKLNIAVRVFLCFLLVVAIIVFLVCIMQTNELREQAKEKEAYVDELRDDIQQLQYMVEAPLDDEFKIRIAREKLGMCFPDEIIFYGTYQ